MKRSLRDNTLSAFNGIDLIEIKKAKRLYENHKNRLGSFFSLKEISYIKEGLRPYENFAVLVAAKEAVFKAFSNVGTGLSVFRNIEIIPGAGQRFSFKLKNRTEKAKFNFSVFKKRKYIIVQCAGI